MILFAADSHSDFESVISAADNASAVVLLGDQEPDLPLDLALGDELAKKTWWIFGNHDSDYERSFANHDCMADRNLHCKIVEVDGIRIAGLGGVFRGKKFGVEQDTRLYEVGKVTPFETRESFVQYRRDRHPLPIDYTTIFSEDIENLLRLKGNVDILVTHEAPESHQLGFWLIGDLARALGAYMIIHGHHHERYSATLSGHVRVQGVGVSRADFFYY